MLFRSNLLPKLMEEAEARGRVFPRKGALMRPQINHIEWVANATLVKNPDGTAVDGTNVLQIHRDALRPGARVIIVDDVLATGGTVAGTLKLVDQLGAIPVAISFLAELPALGGRSRLPEGIVSAIIPF